jgi:4-hydroxy-tetrahydrodipicolinate synthase
MGQMYTFSYEDTKAMITTACTHLAGKAPVVVGTTGIWPRNYDTPADRATFTREAIELTRFAEDAGASATVHTLPEAIRPEQGETPVDVTMRYFEAISEATGIPILVYQPPSMSAEYCVTVDSIRALAAIPKLRGIKVSSKDAEYVLDLTWALQGTELAFISGHECAFYAGLCSGAQAVIGQGCCINPTVLKAVQDRFEAEDYAGAMDAQRSANYLVQTSKGPVEFLKRYAAENGYPVQPFGRSAKSNPYASDPEPLTQAQYNAYKQILEDELARYA